MKYDKDAYIDCGMYDGDCSDYMDCHKEKIVKCRKKHRCVSCQRIIEPGEQALYETGFMDGHPVSAYTCLPCIEDWLEESGQVDIEAGEQK